MASTFILNINIKLILRKFLKLVSYVKNAKVSLFSQPHKLILSDFQN